jgi:heterodisulfide reductase subunit B
MKVAKRFEEDFSTPAVYYFQLLAFAQGMPYADLGLERQRFKPECLTRFEEHTGGCEAAAGGKEVPSG